MDLKSCHVIYWKYKNPRCFGGVNSLPGQYHPNTKAWMATENISDMVAQSRSAIPTQEQKQSFLQTTCTAHNSQPLKAIKLDIFSSQLHQSFSTNVIRAGIIASLKSQYCQQILSPEI